MKVLFVITKADEIGGAQIHIRDLSTRLIEDECEVEVIVGEDGALVSELTNRNIPVHIVPTLVRNIDPIKDFKTILSIRALIKELKPDLISLHSSKAGIVGRLAAALTKVPVIFTAHGWAFANGVGKKQQQLYIFIEKMMAPLAKKIITVSKQDKELALKYNVASHEKQVVIHNGMPELDLNPKEKSLTPNKNKTINMISVARFSEQKDHKTMFLALSELTDLDWRLQLVGKGPLLEQYQQLAAELGIAKRIEFMGERHDVAQLLSNSDIFLLISNWEGFPRSILEAMRAGISVIASDVGGSSESLIDNETGFLIKRGDVRMLKDKIRYLIENPNLREQLGAAGYARYKANFTFEAMYTKTKALYASLLTPH
ncbi:glycosyltransferase family 4 protein [Lelliottia amnigena]